MQESSEYKKLREELRDAEIALIDQRERVAALRRQLPLGTVVPDHRFVEVTPEGDTTPVHLGALLGDGSRTLVLVHFMFGKAQREPCPMCTLWADGYDGIVPHLRQRVEFAAHTALQGFVHHLVLLNPGLAGKRIGDHVRQVVVAVTA